MSFLVWTLTAWALILICFFFMPEPSLERGIKPVNINYVYGFSADEPQSWMPPGLWVALEMIALPLLLYWPTHLILRVHPGERDSRRHLQSASR